METLVKHENAVWFSLTIAGAILLLAAFWLGTTGSKLFMLSAVLCIALLGLRDLVTQSAKQHQTSIQLSQIADALAIEYQESASLDDLGLPDSFELTKRGNAMARSIEENLNANSMIGKFASLAIPKARHLMTHPVGAAKVALFDYEYSDNDVTYRQAVAAVASPKLAYSYVGLFPSNLWHDLVDRFHSAPIVLNRHRFACDQTTPPQGLSAIVDTLAANASLEVGDGFMLLYRNNRRPLQSYEVRELMDEVQRVYTTVCDNLKPPQSGTDNYGAAAT